MDCHTGRIFNGRVFMENGHPVVESFPGMNLHPLDGNVAIKVSVNDPKTKGGLLYFFVHKPCVGFEGGFNASLQYSLKLVDSEYTLYRPVVDKATGVSILKELPDKVSRDDLMGMVLDTRNKFLKKLPAYKKSRVASKEVQSSNILYQCYGNTRVALDGGTVMDYPLPSKGESHIF